MDSSQGDFYRKQAWTSTDGEDDASCSLQIIGFMSFLVTHSTAGHKHRQLKNLFETKLKKLCRFCFN